MSNHVPTRTYSLVLALMVIAVGGLSGPVLAQDYVPDQLICEVMNVAYIDTINARYNTQTLDYEPETEMYLLQIMTGADPDSLAQEILAAEDFVSVCEPNYILEVPEGVQASSPFLDEFTGSDVSRQVAGEQIKLSGAQEIATGVDVRVGIIDGGIDFIHTALSSVATPGYDFVDDDSDPTDEPGGRFSGHGSFVAGVVNFVAPNAKIVGYRVLDTTGRGDGFSIAEALVAAVSDSCQVVNLSLVMSGVHSAVDQAIDYVRANDVIVVAVAGNDSTNTMRFPATDSATICVTAIDSQFTKADFSNFGPEVDICAPGVHIFSTYLNDEYARWDGTSFAAPFVTGQLAMMADMAPDATDEELMSALTSSAVNIDSLNPGLEGQLGGGALLPAAGMKVFGGFICGDIDQDFDGPDISDILFLVNHMFKGGPEPEVIGAVNTNGSTDGINIWDLTYTVEYMFIPGIHDLQCVITW